ncbi:hypothetical protein I6N57_18695, partial [Acinetobacter baumannii]|uniref:hypothetical protein n=1 Tax=Acinetobacter baumannii TaxID=470 RepID=UPI001FB1F6B1
ASGALPSAPPARNRKPQITREVLYQQADELRTLNAEIERREAALARMEKELGVGADTVNTRLDGAIRVPRGRPEDIAVYQRLQRELGQLVTRRDELTDEVRANTEAFRRAQEQRQRQQRETDLYNRYGGAADFLNRIK